MQPDKLLNGLGEQPKQYYPTRGIRVQVVPELYRPRQKRIPLNVNASKQCNGWGYSYQLRNPPLVTNMLQWSLAESATPHCLQNKRGANNDPACAETASAFTGPGPARTKKKCTSKYTSSQEEEEEVDA